MASAVLSLPPPPLSPHDYPLSHSSTPQTSTPPRMPSRPTTPRPLSLMTLMPHLSQPISAPQTPVTATHVVGMERCRSSEPVLGNPFAPDGERKLDLGRGGRGRDIKATSLLFKTVPSAEQIQSTEKGEWHHIEGSSPQVAPQPEQDLRMDIDDEENDLDDLQEECQPTVWGMPRWGCENERGGEVRKGVRLVGMEELPGLISQHQHIDTPSHVLFPWLHGICDDGQKGVDMASFFGYAPPFQPPPYRGLSLMYVGQHMINKLEQKQKRRSPLSDAPQPLTRAEPSVTVDYDPAFNRPETRQRSDTMSTAESYYSCDNGDYSSSSTSDFPPTPATVKSQGDVDVQMHPTESKRPSTAAVDPREPTDNHKTWIPLFGGPPVYADEDSESLPELTSDSSDSLDDEQAPNCILLNALHVQDIFDLPGTSRHYIGEPRFRPPRLPGAINLRNLNIQQIKYPSISDIILYAKGGVSDGLLKVAEMVAQAQEDMYQFRMDDFYRHVEDGSAQEGVSRPVKYGVWCIVEPFHKLEAFCPDLVNLDSNGNTTERSPLTDLFEREASESRAMTRGSEVVEGFWVGNSCDMPGKDGLGSEMSFDLCVGCVEGLEMPSTTVLNQTYRRLTEQDKRRSKIEEEKSSWTASPATLALRNLLSPSASASTLPELPAKRGASPIEENTRQRKVKCDDEFVALMCSGSGRPFNGPQRNLNVLAEKFVELIYFLRKAIEGRDRSGIKRKVLVHCQDGYTESSILVLGYIMSSLSISLPEAYLHLQNTAQRSFFLYPNDRPFLKKIDARLAADRKTKALKLINSANPSPANITSPIGNLSRWKSWTLGLNKAEAKSTGDLGKQHTVEAARELLAQDERGGSDAYLKAKVWFEDKRFDGFPSRILPFLYLGNLEHAGNAGMLEALGITHVVSVGETLISCQRDCDPMYGKIGANALVNAYQDGRIKVMDILAIRDDGNDPLRPTIANACDWIEKARLDGGKVLVHCRVGVSRSASIVIAYMMQNLRMSLMDAYLVTRARRLNVLIQPNLRFFHELFGWEVELARREEDEHMRLANQMREQGLTGSQGDIESPGARKKREILYSWPSFCRDLYCLNRRFLCN